MNTEHWPLLINLLTGFVAVVPVTLLVWIFKKISPSPTKTLIFGVTLIVWATVIFAWLSSGLTGMEATVADSLKEQQLKKDVVSSLSLWVFAFPAVILAIGANLITQYILSDQNT